MRRLMIVPALLAGLLMGGVVGIAVGSSSVPQIHACITPHSDVLVYSSTGKCATGAKLVTWNTTGVPGRDGAPGAMGPQGPAGTSGGSSGPSAIAFYQIDGPGVNLAAVATVVSVNVKPGSYLVSLQVAPSAGQATSGVCFLTTNGSEGVSAAPGFASASFTAPGFISFQGYIASASAIYGRCYTDSVGHAVQIVGARLIATAATQLPAVQ